MTRPGSGGDRGRIRGRFSRLRSDQGRFSRSDQGRFSRLRGCISETFPLSADASRLSPDTSPLSGVAWLVGGLLLSAGLVTLAGCTIEPAPARCVRVELGSMGPENQFRLLVASDAGQVLDESADRLEVGMSIVPPVSGPVTLVQQDESGRELARWDLEVGKVNGLSTRCSVGFGAATSTCKVSLPSPPFSAAGDWRLQDNGNRVLEAGLSLRLCR